MARVKRSISDRPAKVKCKEWLESNGFTNVKSARNQNCDLVAQKSNRVYYIEIKYSSKTHGKFFGTVMLTELYKAITNKENYLFLVCRGEGDDVNQWLFRLFTVDEFLKCCTLTTPIFLYALDASANFQLTAPRFTNKTVMASDKLITQMWEDLGKWKTENQTKD